MGILLCEQHFRDVWSRNESVRAEIGHILHTDTHNRGKISSKDIDHKDVTLNIGHTHYLALMQNPDPPSLRISVIIFR